MSKEPTEDKTKCNSITRGVKFADRKPLHLNFSDRVSLDVTNKTVISARDGVLEYMGSELGPKFEPNRIYTIYRSPSTIANAAMNMAGIPITDEHVSLDMPAPTDGGAVDTAQLVDTYDPSTVSTISIKNSVSLSDKMVAILEESGKREASLGYGADLVEHDGEYDYEQLNIKSHHLAAVNDGRCGSLCSFLDRKPQLPEPRERTPMKLHQAFLDAEGEMSLQQIVEVSMALPDAIKSVPIDKIQEVMPALKELVDISKAVSTDPEEDVVDDEGNSERFTDSKAFQDAVNTAAEEKATQLAEEKATQLAEEKAKEFSDKAIKEHAAVIEKAQKFVGDDYSFADKSTEQIMKDALATQTTDEFADEELRTAFKLLRQPESDYRNFGDQQTQGLSGLSDKEL